MKDNMGFLKGRPAMILSLQQFWPVPHAPDLLSQQFNG